MKPTNSRHCRSIRAALSLGLVLCLAAATGCGTTSAQKDASGGAAIGAIAGGLLGGWQGAAIGAATGGGLGYMAGNEKDKQEAKEQAERDRAALDRSRVTSNRATAYRPDNTNPLVGTTWRVVSYVGEDEAELQDYSAILVTFATNTRLNTLSVKTDGTSETVVEKYRIVEDSLIISGQAEGERYVINGKLSTSEGEMVYVTPTSTTVLEEVKEAS